MSLDFTVGKLLGREHEARFVPGAHPLTGPQAVGVGGFRVKGCCRKFFCKCIDCFAEVLCVFQRGDSSKFPELIMELPRSSTSTLALSSAEVFGRSAAAHSEKAVCYFFHSPRLTWGLPKVRVTFLGVRVIRTIIFWGLYWGPPI